MPHRRWRADAPCLGHSRHPAINRPATRRTTRGSSGTSPKLLCPNPKWVRREVHQSAHRVAFRPVVGEPLCDCGFQHPSVVCADGVEQCAGQTLRVVRDGGQPHHLFRAPAGGFAPAMVPCLTVIGPASSPTEPVSRHVWGRSRQSERRRTLSRTRAHRCLRRIGKKRPRISPEPLSTCVNLGRADRI